MNRLVGYASMSENVLGLLVLASLILVGMGFVPSVRKWPHARIANYVMSVSLAIYAVSVVASTLRRD
jgi:hypothetical protein